ncbi:MAG: GNAT family protein [Candidatus Lernaella stagnicola]|nr:GNAT family protein [Candidatus Lernaella stagnicola]
MVDKAPVLHAGSLRMEPLRERHLDDLWPMFRDSRDALLPYMFWAHTQTDRESQLAFIRNSERARDEEREQVFLVFAGDVAVATLGLHQLASPHRGAELGFWVHTAHTGRGICTAIAARSTRYAFDELGLHRLFIRHGLDNHASRAVIHKLGFVHEGTARDDLWVGDRFVSHEYYAMLEDDFTSARERLLALETSARI